MIRAGQPMKVLIVSDIHANRVALQAVLAAEPDHENALCLGDLVDYGPNPVECIAYVWRSKVWASLTTSLLVILICLVTFVPVSRKSSTPAV